MRRAAIWRPNLDRIHTGVVLRWLGPKHYATFSPPPPRPTASTPNDTRHDDVVLRQVFDSREFWRDFNVPSASQTQISTGLFQNRYLDTPEGFPRFAKEIRERCQELVGRIVHASSVEECKIIPRQLDLLSDYLCRVLDLADFTRANHPDAVFQDNATTAFTLLWEYMNILNTTPGLKSQLQKVIASPSISSSWNEEEWSVAKNLLRDFSNSAIDLPAEYRQKFVTLSNEVKHLGSAFSEGMGPAASEIRLGSAQVNGLDPLILREHTTGDGMVSLPLGDGTAYSALGTVQNQNTRRRIYSSMRTSSKQQLEILERLLKVRSEIAALSKFGSYAAMNLSDKMARTPEAVNSFLTALTVDNAPYVAQELDSLSQQKRLDGLTDRLQPWDTYFFQQRQDTKMKQMARRPTPISAFFSLGTVMQGLSRLFSRLYGIRFVPQQTMRGETWDKQVRRLDVVHEDEGHVAVLYCDLFERENKLPTPAHFTIRCSREISSAEIADKTLASDDGMARAISPTTGRLYQLPTIALVCDFPHPVGPNKPSLLSFREVQTLFHEMGHAIHSILGRTSLQVVSGTRCATDFAELPSVLMENFAVDESVLKLFARHWETDAPLPYEMVEDTLRIQKGGQGQQTETQLLYSLLDQAFHSPLAGQADFDSTKTFFEIYDRYGSLQEPRDISPQGFFGHLIEYGGTYYSYLFDRAIAGKIWRDVFNAGHNQGALDRKAGEKFHQAVLRWGGGRDAWKCVGEVLDNEKLMEGGKEAMEMVGKWGVHD